MRARFVYEAFKEDSDPISDMGIGGFNIKQIYEDIVENANKQFNDFLRSLIGKKISIVPLNSTTRKIIKVRDVGQHWINRWDIWFFVDNESQFSDIIKPDLTKKIYIIEN